jgi:GTP cyclohydrolase I
MKKKTDTEASARSYVDTALKSVGRADLSKEDYEKTVKRVASAYADLGRVARRSVARRGGAASN